MAKQESIRYYQGRLIDDMKPDDLKLALKKMVRQAQMQREEALKIIVDLGGIVVQLPKGVRPLGDSIECGSKIARPEAVPNLDNMRTNE